MTVEDTSPSGLVNINKIKDVKRLLIKHYGENWSEDEELIFYKSLIVDTANIEDGTLNSNETHENLNEVLCEFQNEEPILRI